MEKLYVVLDAHELAGVYTTHRKAMQAVIFDTIKRGMRILDYSFESNVEFLEFISPDCGAHFIWEIHEVTPDTKE